MLRYSLLSPVLPDVRYKYSFCLYQHHIGSAVENNWIEGWQKKNWVNAKNEPIANAKEWQNLLKLLEGHKYSVVVGFKHEYASWMKRELDKKNDEKA